MAGSDSAPTLVQPIARNVLGVADAAIPVEVVEQTKALILDSIGCALAAAEKPATRTTTPSCARAGASEAGSSWPFRRSG